MGEHVNKFFYHCPYEFLYTNFFAEEAYSEGGRQISDLAKRNTLLSAYSKQCKQLAELYRNLAKQINDKITICKDVARCAIHVHTCNYAFNLL